jgi:hypothetical protein
MTEDLLHFIWKFQLFNKQLKTVSGQAIEVIHPGSYNTNAGPDFFNAKIKIGETLWAGNVEIHVKSSDYIKHQHHQDKAYQNIILHVVYENDTHQQEEANFPVLEIRNYFSNQIAEIYHQFLQSKTWIPCENNLKNVSQLNITSWLQRLAVERIERKAKETKQLLLQFNKDWEHVFFIQLAKAFGFKVNTAAFELWAKSLPYHLLLKHRNNSLQVEALIFGQAGFLEDDFSDDSYYIALKNEYAFLRTKYHLKPIDKHLWKFLRLRPRNFPTIRLAQLAEIIKKQANLFSAFIEAENIQSLIKLLNVQVAEYWQNHFEFGKDSTPLKKTLGLKSAHSIIINAIVPILFAYSNYSGKEELKEKAIEFLEHIEPEKNSIINNWMELGIKPQSALESQALLELKNEYCSQKKCLNCSIGNAILKQL